VCRALFGEEVSTVEGSRAFEERYRDRRFRWRGVLRSAGEYSFDFELEGGPGARADLEVSEVPGPFGAAMVHAVIQLPAGASEALAGRIGSAFMIEGRLRSVDRLMRRLFIADGRLSPEGPPPA
jgi:hypothetical protein